MKSLNIFLVILLSTASLISSQETSKSKGVYKPEKNEFWDKIKTSSEAFSKKPEVEKSVFKADFSGYDIPKSKEEFKYQWHNDPKELSQGNTGTCWDFCATSFFESEVYRLRGEKLKLSELYVAYWEFVEKAKRFVQERGNSVFDHGSESNGLMRIWKTYGVVPHAAFTGLLPGQEFHDHSKMYDEMNTYLQSVKSNQAWDENTVVQTIQSILNHYLGTPPEKVEVNGKLLTPKEYFEQVVNIDLNNYIEFQSTIKQPYYQKTEFEVPDNWWHSKDYINIPLDEFMSTLKSAVRNNYTVCIGGDVSEPGIDGYEQAAIVPEFDIPSQYINEFSREFRISNGTTADDHGIHLIGYKEVNRKDWYLIKDSGASSRNGNDFGYYFFHEDFVKLKMLTFMVHKDAAKEVLKKIK